MTPYGDRALSDELAILRSAGDGGRNEQLNRSTFAIAQLVAGEQIEAGKAKQALRDASTEAGLAPREIASTLESAWKAGMAQPRYVYGDRDGRVSYAKTRLGSGAMKYGYHHRDGDGAWQAGRGEAKAVPYRLADLIAAPESAVLYMAEGEKHADKLARWGLLATSLKDWQAEFAEHVTGRAVVIIPDNDDGGEQQAERARSLVTDAGGRPVIVRLPGLDHKQDIMDWAGDAAELAKLVESALTGDRPAPLPTIDLVACSSNSAPPRIWTVADMVPFRKVTLITGKGAVGKSLAVQQLCTCIALGLEFAGQETRQSPAAYMTWEDDADELWRRQEAICKSLGVPMAKLADRLHLVSLTEEGEAFIVRFDPSNKPIITDVFHRIEAFLQGHDIGFLGLDNASQIMGGDHNALEHVSPFALILNALAQRMGDDGGSIMLLHHPNKAGDDWLGSVGYENQFRSRLLMSRTDGGDPDQRVIINPKANYSQGSTELRFRWYQGAFVRDEDLPPNLAGQIAETAQIGGDNLLFLACLAERNRQRRAVSEKRSPTYAPTEFAKMAESKGIGKVRLEAAMNRLFKLDKIERAQLWIGDDRKPVFGLRETAGNGAVNTVRETRVTVAGAPESRAGNAGETHTVSKDSAGAALGAAALEARSRTIDFSRWEESRVGGMVLAPGETGDDADLGR